VGQSRLAGPLTPPKNQGGSGGDRIRKRGEVHVSILPFFSGMSNRCGGIIGVVFALGLDLDEFDLGRAVHFERFDVGCQTTPENAPSVDPVRVVFYPRGSPVGDDFVPVDDPGPRPEGRPESVFRAVEEAARGPPETVRSLPEVAVADESFGGLVVAPSFVRKQPRVRDKANPTRSSDFDNGGQPGKPQDLVVCQRLVGILPTLLLGHRIAIVFRVGFDAQFVGPPANGDFFVVRKHSTGQADVAAEFDTGDHFTRARTPIDEVTNKNRSIGGS